MIRRAEPNSVSERVGRTSTCSHVVFIILLGVCREWGIQPLLYATFPYSVLTPSKTLNPEPVFPTYPQQVMEGKVALGARGVFALNFRRRHDNARMQGCTHDGFLKLVVPFWGFLE